MNSMTAPEELRYEHVLPGRYGRLWSDWEIRIFVLSSLALQVTLIVLAPSRKVRPSRRIRFITWAFYLLADCVANFALGHLADNQSEGSAITVRPLEGFICSNAKNHTSVGGAYEVHGLSRYRAAAGSNSRNQGSSSNSKLLAFWAPFLLLHLGGPDTITAFTLEDNELWLRHLWGLFFQLFACGYVLYRSLPHNPLLLPTILMLLVGTIKYAERTYSLYLGSTGGLRNALLMKPDPGPKYFRFAEHYVSRKHIGQTGEINVLHEKDIGQTGERDDPEAAAQEEDDTSLVLSAFKFFNKYKCLVVDLVLSFQERKESRLYFKNLKYEKAFKVIAMELNFLYDALYTKAPVVHKGLWSVAARATSTAGIVASSLIFFFFNKRGFHPVDVRITYTLLIGAISLDALGFILLLTSEWTLVSLDKLSNRRFGKPLSIARILRDCLGLLVTHRCNKKRWSEMVSQLELLRYTLREVPKGNCMSVRHCSPMLEKAASFICGDEIFKESAYVCRKRLHDDLLPLVYEQLRKKSEEAAAKGTTEVTKQLIESKGLSILQEAHVKLGGDKSDIFLRSVEAEFDECVLLWHIATSLCLYEDLKNNEPDNQDKCKQQPPDDQEQKTKPFNKREKLFDWMCNQKKSKQQPPDNQKKSEQQSPDDQKQLSPDQEISRQLSQYMLYLLVLQQDLTLAIGGMAMLRFRDTCEEAKIFFEAIATNLSWKDACAMLLSVNTDVVNPSHVKGDRSKSVLFDGCRLANGLQMLDLEWDSERDSPRMNRSEKWNLIAKVWVELLSYAACHCRGIHHARKLSNGTELLNVVWLLMAQLGLGEYFRIEIGQARPVIV